jgi:hypothetical protein
LWYWIPWTKAEQQLPTPVIATLILANLDLLPE